jgi:hypothetical protein
MIAGHAASPTISPLCSRRPAILGETRIRRSVDPAHLPPPNRLDAAIVEVEGDAPDALAAQHSRGGLLDRLSFGGLAHSAYSVWLLA